MNNSLQDPLPPRPPIWTTTVQIRSYDVHASQCATPTALCRYFLDAAWNHAEALGVGFSHLGQQNLVWVLCRLLMRFSEYPRWGQTVDLSTWPRGTDSLFALRDFEFTSSSGPVLVSGTSSWVVLDRETKRPQRLKSLLAGMPACSSRRAVDRDAEKLPARQTQAPAGQRTAHSSDTDVNAHVNSARYLDWILDACSPELPPKHALSELEINYLGETFAGDRISVFSTPEGSQAAFLSLLKPNQAEVCRAALTWKPAP